MSKNEIKDAFNLGVPSTLYFKLSIYELRQISDDKHQFDDGIHKLTKHFNDRIQYTKGLYNNRIDNNFTDTIIVGTSKNNSQTRIYFDYTNIFIELQKLFNLSKPYSTNYKDNVKRKEIYDQIVLFQKNCRSIETLKEQYPELYKDYLKGEKMFLEICELYKDGKDEIAKKLEDEYERLCLGHQITRFVNRQSYLYKKLLNEFSSLSHICYDHCDHTNLYNFIQGINPNKLQLLLAYKYVQTALLLDDQKSYQDCIFYLLPVLRNTENMKYQIEVDGKVIDYNYIKEMYSKMNGKYDLIPLDMDRKYFNSMKKEDRIKVINKELDRVKVLKKFEGPKKEYPHILRHIERQEKNLRELTDLLDRKKALLDKSDFIELFLTDQGYDGYYYYVYKNGIILREKFFDSYRYFIPSKDEAMYKGNIYVFDKYHNKKNSVLMLAPKDEIDRIYHTKKYEEKALKYIHKRSSKNSLEDTEKFIERIKKSKILVPTINKPIF